jgi:hypothetical protein
LFVSLSFSLFLAALSGASVPSFVEALWRSVLHSWEALVISWSFPLLMLGRMCRPQQIALTPEGVSVRHPDVVWGKPHLIRWQEARLFAIRDGKPGGARVRYELSSPTTVVTFERILRPSFWSRFQPAQPFGEYHMQMEALLALISAHTGLLLYDVRQPN